MLKQLKTDIKKLADPKKAKILARFFKTGKGQYGAGDIFLGITVPEQRKLVKKYWRNLNLADLDKLLRSKIHEERLIALLILVKKFEIGSKISLLAKKGLGEVSKPPIKNHKSSIFRFYLNHTKYINNWDLVDLSAPNVVGEYLLSLSLEGEGKVRGGKRYSDKARQIHEPLGTQNRHFINFCLY